LSSAARTVDPRLHRIVLSLPRFTQDDEAIRVSHQDWLAFDFAAQPYPLLFATIRGAHLYGFASPDSDFDLRGAHVLPLEKVVGLEVRDETVEDSRVIEGLEMEGHRAR